MVLVVGPRLSSWPFNEDLKAFNNYNGLFKINFFSKFHWYSLYQFLSAGPLQRTEPNMHDVDPFLEVARDDGLEFQICSLNLDRLCLIVTSLTQLEIAEKDQVDEMLVSPYCHLWNPGDTNV